MKLTPQQFTERYYFYAKQAELDEGVPALVVLGQSAFESSWGDKVKGNNFFGIKDTDGVNGNEQLITTTEYHKDDKVKYPVILSIKKIKDRLFKYLIKDHFRKYDSPYESFVDYAKFLKRNPRYKIAFTHKDPFLFAEEVVKAGYATDPNYLPTLKKVMLMIKKHIKD